MAKAMASRLEQLKTEIENLRAELRDTVTREGVITNFDKAHSVSDQLDILIMEFLRVKNEVDRTFEG